MKLKMYLMDVAEAGAAVPKTAKAWAAMMGIAVILVSIGMAAGLAMINVKMDIIGIVMIKNVLRIVIVIQTNGTTPEHHAVIAAISKENAAQIVIGQQNTGAQAKVNAPPTNQLTTTPAVQEAAAHGELTAQAVVNGAVGIVMVEMQMQAKFAAHAGGELFNVMEAARVIPQTAAALDGLIQAQNAATAELITNIAMDAITTSDLDALAKGLALQETKQAQAAIMAKKYAVALANGVPALFHPHATALQ